MNKGLLTTSDINLKLLKHTANVEHHKVLMTLCTEVERVCGCDDLNEPGLVRNFFALYSALKDSCNPEDIQTALQDTQFEDAFEWLVKLWNYVMGPFDAPQENVAGNMGAFGLHSHCVEQSIERCVKYGVCEIKVDCMWSATEGVFLVHKSHRTIEDILKLVPDHGKVIANWDAKLIDCCDDVAAAALVKALRDARCKTCAMSNNCVALQHLRDIDKHISLGFVTSSVYDEGYASIIEQFSLEFVCINSFSICHLLVNKVHDNNALVYAQVSNSYKEKEYLAACGVDMIITDYPLKASLAC